MEMKEEQYTAPVSSEPTNDGLKAAAAKRGGPRTAAGKQRSKFNATTHGIFSSVVLLKDDFPREYTALLKGLQESFQPVGRAEELFVEKLATIAWRQRRLLETETAEIDRLQDSIVQDRLELKWLRETAREVQQEKGVSLFSFWGLIRGELNMEIVGECIGLLKQLRERTKAEGVDFPLVHSVLSRIYNLWAPLSQLLRLIQTEASLVVEDKQPHSSNLPMDTWKEMVIEGVDFEVKLLSRFKSQIEEYQSDRKKQDKQCLSVLDSPALDRLMRYEAHLSRLEDRTLVQLERLQRIRLGQPVPPPVKVEVSRN